MFSRRCSNPEPHSQHTYKHHWVKEALPFLPDAVSATLPEEWDVEYKCSGVPLWINPTAEVDESWKVERDHEFCQYCDMAVAAALDDAKEHHKPGSVWTVYAPDEGQGKKHKAAVTRL